MAKAQAKAEKKKAEKRITQGFEVRVADEMKDESILKPSERSPQYPAKVMGRKLGSIPDVLKKLVVMERQSSSLVWEVSDAPGYTYDDSVTGIEMEFALDDSDGSKGQDEVAASDMVMESDWADTRILDAARANVKSRLVRCFFDHDDHKAFCSSMPLICPAHRIYSPQA